MTDLSGRHWIDGKDLWTVWSMFIESGSDGFLKYASKKDSITHDWLDNDGLDVDLSQVFFNSRDITLNAALIAYSEQEFHDKYESFIFQMKQPGHRRIEVNEFGSRSYYCFYKECNNFTRYTRLKDGTTPIIAVKFTIVFTETNPSVNNENVFIVDDEGRFLIT